MNRNTQQAHAMKLTSVPKAFTTAEIDKILGQFPKNASITRHESTAVVHAPTGEKVLSAAEIQEGRWHVMCVPGLLIPVKPEGRK